MQISHSGIPVPVPLPVWYYSQCIRFPGTSIHPAFTRALLPVPNAQGASLRLSPSISETSPTNHVLSSASPDANSLWHHESSKPKKNSFSIDAILNRDSCKSEEISPRGESMTEAATCLAATEKRRQRLYNTSHPYISTTYSTNIHYQNHHQYQVCQDSKTAEEDSLSGRCPNGSTVSRITPGDRKRQLSIQSHGQIQNKISSPSKGCKRVRTIFTPEQLERLEYEFSRQQYMVGTERYYLAGKLDLTEVQVKVWFQNRRIKMRKQQQEAMKAHYTQCRFMAETDSEEEDEEADEEDVEEEDEDEREGGRVAEGEEERQVEDQRIGESGERGDRVNRIHSNSNSSNSSSSSSSNSSGGGSCNNSNNNNNNIYNGSNNNNINSSFSSCSSSSSSSSYNSDNRVVNLNNSNSNIRNGNVIKNSNDSMYTNSNNNNNRRL